MKPMVLRALAICQLLVAANADRLSAQTNSSAETVTCRTNTSLLQRGAELTPLTEGLTMPGGIEVFTNGTFRVKEGKTRLLKEGEILRGDGYLLKPDGAVMPVFDHIAMSQGRVTVFKDGEGEALSAPLTFPDGSVINPDGSYWRPAGSYGRRSRLAEGRLLTLEGVSLGGLDTISLRNGKVVVHKSGALIPLQASNQTTAMSDGTRVRGDGLISYPGGATVQLAEGQIITVPGLRAEW
jgi:hypothetical protein